MSTKNVKQFIKFKYNIFIDSDKLENITKIWILKNILETWPVKQMKNKE